MWTSSNRLTQPISQDEFDKMKRGAVLINTARGDVVDTTALVRALAEQKLSAVGLDVLPDEPVIREEAARILDTTLENIRAFAEGEPINVVSS